MKNKKVKVCCRCKIVEIVKKTQTYCLPCERDYRKERRKIPEIGDKIRMTDNLNRLNSLDAHREKQKKSYNKNRDKVLAKARANYDRDKVREYKLRYTYGITGEEYEQMLVAQNGCCYLCDKNSKTMKHGLYVDHCHSTGKIRKLLCNTCNVGIGMLKDDVALLKKAIEYLEYHSVE